MRVYLTTRELEEPAGQQLLTVCRAITEDGKLDLDEIKLLRRWLRANQDATVAAVPYLTEILDRIVADGVIDADELQELHLAIERVIPTTHRKSAIDARKAREAVKKERRKERKQQERELEKERKREEREAERVRANQIRHTFAKVAGVSFPNDNGTDRQNFIRRCRKGERLLLEPDDGNPYSDVAVKVVRENGNQIGHAPEYLAERISENLAMGKRVTAYVAEITGGEWDKPLCGVNFLVVFSASDVTDAEVGEYANEQLDGGGRRSM